MVRRIRFTKSSLAQLRFGSKAVLVADSEIPGLKLKVHPVAKSGGCKPRKTFLLEKRIKGRKGSAVTFTLGTFPNMAVDQARQKARLYANLCEQGLDPREQEKQRQARNSKRRVTLREAVERYWSLHRKNLAPATIDWIENLIRRYFKDWMGRDLCKLTPDDLVEKYLSDLRRSKHCAMKSLMVFGQIWKRVSPTIRENGKRLLPDNPVPVAKRTIGKWKLDPPRRTVIPLHKLGEFVATLEKGYRDPEVPIGTRSVYAALLTCLFCGLRYGECRKLKWEHVDLELGVLTVIAENAKNRHEHSVPYAGYVGNLLKEWRLIRDCASPFIYSSPTRKSGFRSIDKRWLVSHLLSETLEFPFSPHATRRTFASIGNYLGLPFLTIKRLINHHYQGGITGGYVVQGFDPLQNRKHFKAIADFILEKRDEYLGVERPVEQTKLEQLNAFAVSVGLSPREILNWAHSDGMRRPEVPSQASIPS